ncbi:MAG: DsbC family protein [Nitrospirae bacterium]|nr:DsbC family protein [Nitrospirota bacterium]
MKRIFLAVLMLVVFAATACAQNKKVEEFEVVKNFLPAINAKVIETRDIGSLYEITVTQEKKKGVIYVTKDGKYLVIGYLLDKDKKNVTQEKYNEINKIDFSKLPLQDALVIKKGNGAKKLIMFTDVDCPFCKKAHNWLKEKTNYTLHVYLMALPSHPKAAEKSVKIFCAKNPENALDMAKNDKEITGDKCEAGEKKLKLHMDLAKDLGVSGTPLFITEKGEKIEGFVQQALEDYLK